MIATNHECVGMEVVVHFLEGTMYCESPLFFYWPLGLGSAKLIGEELPSSLLNSQTPSDAPLSIGTSHIYLSDSPKVWLSLTKSG